MESFILSLCENVDNDNYFLKVVEECNTLKEYSMQELFVVFSKIYLKKSYNLGNIWFRNNIPIEHLNKIGLTDNDLGIDLIGLDNSGVYYLICAKYRQRCTHNITLGHKDLNNYKRSISRLDGYKYIIITNADNVKNIDKKQIDYITYDVLINIQKTDVVMSLEDLRNERVKYYIKNNIIE